jgi:hypothetical protein
MQVSCNMTKGAKKCAPKCCVLFSSFNNDSIVPCSTCVCGYKANAQPACSSNALAILLPYSALTLASRNQTAQMLVGRV